MNNTLAVKDMLLKTVETTTYAVVSRSAEFYADDPKFISEICFLSLSTFVRLIVQDLPIDIPIEELLIAVEKGFERAMQTRKETTPPLKILNPKNKLDVN